MKKSVLNAIAVSTLAAFLAACGEPDAEDIQKTGLSPLAAPDRTLTCYDYNGNKTIQEKPTDSVGFSSSYGYTEGKYQGNRKPTYVSGGAGCLSDTLYFDPKNQNNAEIYSRAVQTAPYTVIVTNGMDKIILADKFTSVTNLSGETRLELQVNDVTIRRVSINGMQVIATENREEIDGAITEGMKALKP
ncbi:MAG: hypothetical protein HYS17_08295 [Micavibrio aeruginosavorus]|uniref:Lipoprotein n=1 Tax=Micavibrio aeruginosavorus TaxID=349221 RepID=A0A7T5UH17_9BACT|nr:MAG: hypothetical protein HYS17_08295 [Micavibrio aeruginosavorus]